MSSNSNNNYPDGNIKNGAQLLLSEDENQSSILNEPDSDMDLDDVDNSYTNEDIEELEAQAGLTGQTAHLDIDQRLELLAKCNVKLNKPRAQRRPPIGGKWTAEEDAELKAVVDMHGPKNWKKIAELLGDTRTDVQCLHRWNKVLKPGLHKGPWLEYEDVLVRDMVLLYGVGKVKWSSIAAQLPGRIGKQCRERWFNHLDPAIKKGDWTLEEDTVLYEAQKQWGNRWCEIAKMLPGRTENAVKNRWNSSSMKKWLKDNHLSVGPAYGPNTVALYEDSGSVNGSGKAKETNGRRKKDNRNLSSGSDSEGAGSVAPAPAVTSSNSLLAKMPAHLRPPMISTTPLANDKGSNINQNTHSTINNLLNVGPQTSKHLIELLTTTFNSPMHPNPSHNHSIDQVLGLNIPTMEPIDDSGGVGSIGGIALNSADIKSQSHMDQMGPFSPLSNQYSPTGLLYNDHESNFNDIRMESDEGQPPPHLPPPSGMGMLFDLKRGQKKKEKLEKRTKIPSSSAVINAAGSNEGSETSSEPAFKKRKSSHGSVSRSEPTVRGPLSPIDKAVQFLRQKLETLNNGKNNNRSGVEEVPLELLPFFNILNYDAQRTLVKQLVEKFQRTSLTPRGNMSLTTPRFVLGPGVNSNLLQNPNNCHAQSQSMGGSVYSSMSQSNSNFSGTGSSCSNLNELKDVLGLRGTTPKAQNQHGCAVGNSSAVSFDPHCFEDNTMEMNREDSEDDLKVNDSSPGGDTYSSGGNFHVPVKSGRGRGKKQIALEQQQMETNLQLNPNINNNGDSIAMGEGDDLSLQAAVLITYQVASKCASIDELLQNLLPPSDQDEGEDQGRQYEQENRQYLNDDKESSHRVGEGSGNISSDLDGDSHHNSGHYSPFPSGTFSNVEIKSPAVHHHRPSLGYNGGNENVDNSYAMSSSHLHQQQNSPYAGSGIDQDLIVESSFKKKSPRNNKHH